MRSKVNFRQAKIAVIFLIFVNFVSLPQVSLSFQDVMEPKYASSETREIIKNMLKAHGGMKKWRSAPSVSYDFVMYLPIMEQMTGGKMKGWQLWRAAHTTIEPKTRRAYTDLPWEGANIASDGKRIWTVEYKGGNPPLFRLWHHASFVNMPWLLEDRRVHLGKPTKAKLPNDPKEYIVIRMTAERNGQVNSEKFFDLYIDPDTYLLKANAYNMAFFAVPEPLTPSQYMPFPGTMLRIVDDYVTTSGLTVPSRYTTTDLSGDKLFGVHLLLNVSASEAFDETRMNMPSDDAGRD